MKYAAAGEVMDVIAHFILPNAPAQTKIGTIQLRSHQRNGVSRIMQSLGEYRGALLCDAVGLGKTFTAAAVMRQFASSVVVAPASLIPMWSDSLERAGVSKTILSLETFSRKHIDSTG